MLSSKKPCEGTVMSGRSMKKTVAQGNAKWKPCPLDWISMYAQQVRESGQEIPSTTDDFSMSQTSLDLFQDLELDMVNADRTSLSANAVRRSPQLDRLAQENVQRMVKARKVMHSDPTHVLSKVQGGTNKVGENVGRGRDFDKAYEKMMKVPSNFCNVADPDYEEMGMAMATGKDGKIYVCQLFRG